MTTTTQTAQTTAAPPGTGSVPLPSNGPIRPATTAAGQAASGAPAPTLAPPGILPSNGPLPAPVPTPRRASDEPPDPASILPRSGPR